jgi:hypothetical protein
VEKTEAEEGEDKKSTVSEEEKSEAEEGEEEKSDVHEEEKDKEKLS